MFHEDVVIHQRKLALWWSDTPQYKYNIKTKINRLDMLLKVQKVFTGKLTYKYHISLYLGYGVLVERLQNT